MLLFWCSWLSTGSLNLIGHSRKILLSFCGVRDSVVDCVNVSPSARVELNHGLHDAQNVCAPTKVGTVLKVIPQYCIAHPVPTAHNFTRD